MIVSRVSDPVLQQALRRAAHPEEELVTDAFLGVEALQLGFPRLLVRSGSALRETAPAGLRILDLDDVTLRRWEAERRAEELPAPRLDDLVRRLRILTERSSTERTWADAAIADLGRAAGMPLPPALRTFARRVFEFPSRYTSLHDLADACGLSRGALKARFRRRGLASPYTYLRWFRSMAVAEMLSDRDVSVARAAHRLGFTSAGNLCRTIASMAETTPTELRTVRGWNRLVVRFAWIHLTPEALEGWRGLGLFQRRRRVA
jgi:AraC-like DNA-binding protein